MKRPFPVARLDTMTRRNVALVLPLMPKGLKAEEVPGRLVYLVTGRDSAGTRNKKRWQRLCDYALRLM